MVLSSRDRILVSVFLLVWLAPTPGHRRLRFSFQFNDFKDPLGFLQVRRYARRRRGGASLKPVPGSVNRLLIFSGKLRRKAKRSPWGRQGLPHQSVSESIEGVVFSPTSSERQELYEES